MVRRLLDVLTEEERELQARVTALRVEVEKLEKKSASLKVRTKKQQIALDKAKADVSKARDEAVDMTQQALGIKDGGKNKLPADKLQELRKYWEETQKTQSFDKSRWALVNVPGDCPF